MFENILVETADDIVTVTVNRPKALNALNSKTLSELFEAFDSVPDSARAVIVTGAGEKAFVAGADISEMKGLGANAATEFSWLGHRAFARLESLPQVTIAAINGFALGGGLELAMGCDLLYASDRAKLGQPEVNLGLIPGFGGTQRLARLVGPQLALEMLMTADPIDAPTAKARGLVADVFPSGELLGRVREIAQKIATKGPLAIRAAKALVQRGADMTLDDANFLESREFGRLFETRDAQEGLAAFLEKRAPSFKAD